MTTKLTYEPTFLTKDGFEINKGDFIKITGEYGTRFKFQYITTNTESGSTWVDCFEMHRGQAGAFRSFNTDRIKRIPTRGKRAKRVI